MHFVYLASSFLTSTAARESRPAAESGWISSMSAPRISDRTAITLPLTAEESGAETGTRAELSGAAKASSDVAMAAGALEAAVPLKARQKSVRATIVG